MKYEAVRIQGSGAVYLIKDLLNTKKKEKKKKTCLYSI